jgi:hypothetical protein
MIQKLLLRKINLIQLQNDVVCSCMVFAKYTYKKILSCWSVPKGSANFFLINWINGDKLTFPTLIRATDTLICHLGIQQLFIFVKS